MNIKIINVGKCMMCGNEIKLVTKKNYDKLPEIFFCPKCSRKINNKDYSEGEDRNDRQARLVK